jgi:hypothetical protein
LSSLNENEFSSILLIGMTLPEGLGDRNNLVVSNFVHRVPESIRARDDHRRPGVERNDSPQNAQEAQGVSVPGLRRILPEEIVPLAQHRGDGPRRKIWSRQNDS